jgi:hypothetical protein
MPGEATPWIRFDGDVTVPVALRRVQLRDLVGSVPWRRWRSHHGQAPAWHEVTDGETFGAAERRLAGEAPGWTVRPALLVLLWRHRLSTDLSRQLSGDAVLRRLE